MSYGLCLAADQGNVVTMFSGLNDGTSQVHVPVAIAEVVATPDLPTGLLGAGGPATAVLAGLGVALIVRRRRRSHE